eukprot:scaffold188233_cov63-Attheya_sp.AAC.4
MICKPDFGLVEIGGIIIRVDNNVISMEADLFQALENYKPGDKVKVNVNRVEAVGPTHTDLALKEVTLKDWLSSM